MTLQGSGKNIFLLLLGQKTAPHLEVQVLQTSHGGAADRVGQVEAGEVGLGADNDRVKSNLILESIDIVGSVGIDVLKRFGELIIQAVNESNKGTLDVDGLAVLGDTVLVGFLLLFWDILLDNVLWASLQDGQQEVQVLVSAIVNIEKLLLIIVQFPN